MGVSIKKRNNNFYIFVNKNKKRKAFCAGPDEKIAKKIESKIRYILVVHDFMNYLMGKKENGLSEISWKTFDEMIFHKKMRKLITSLREQAEKTKGE